MTAGTTYYIQAGGFGTPGDFGNLVLNVSLEATGAAGQSVAGHISCSSLGLVADGCDDGSDGDQDDIDALSFGLDFASGSGFTGRDAALAFSVAPGSTGLPGSAVAGQAACSPSQPQADEFSSPLDGTNAILFDGDGQDSGCPSGPALGLTELPSSDDLNALNELPPEVVDQNSDGQLDDAIWQRAAVITEFVQRSPIEGAPATEDTEVYIAFDSTHLYIAMYAHYSNPGMMRANRVDRDRASFSDDTISVYFDTFLDQQRAFVFTLNGYGVQGDSLMGGGRGGGGFRGGSSGVPRGDSSWDVLFDSGGTFVDDGWTAEMAIPFKSLRYPSGDTHRWGFQIARSIRGKAETVVWAPISRDVSGFLPQMGLLDGLRGLSTSRNLEILPTFTGVQTGSLNTTDGRFREGDPIGQMGVGVKYGVTSNLTLDFTYNPDFSQIESDRPQIEVNQRFALFFSEQRPFFLEGQEIFSAATPLTLVHTRTVVDPRFGAKLTGKAGKTTLGVFLADDEAPGRLDDSSAPGFGRTAQSLIGRVRYDLYAESYVGAIATARAFGEDYSRVGGVDGRFRLGRTHQVSFLAVASEHQDELHGRLSGPVFEIDFTRQARNLSYSVSHSSIDPDFRTETGFVPRVDIRRTDANVAYRWWPEGTLLSWGPSVSYLRNYNHAGELEDEQFRGNVNFEFVRNLRFSGGVSRELERFGGVDFRKTGY
ncbi:MAG: carbohydrate binding family 9 domain-containing protein, partial [Acidobacteria bacterium]|nr:carbohydrate binding family 9 domain-containing protein [Acidobacteriota bacterium]